VAAGAATMAALEAFAAREEVVATHAYSPLYTLYIGGTVYKRNENRGRIG